MGDILIDLKKLKTPRANRNTSEAAVEENSKPYDEIGQTDEEIQLKDTDVKKDKPKGLTK